MYILKIVKLLNNIFSGIGSLLLIGLIPFVTCDSDLPESKQLSFFNVVKFPVSTQLGLSEIDLSGLDLSELDLSGLDLSELGLSEFNL